MCRLHNGRGRHQHREIINEVYSILSSLAPACNAIIPAHPLPSWLRMAAAAAAALLKMSLLVSSPTNLRTPYFFSYGRLQNEAFSSGVATLSSP